MNYEIAEYEIVHQLKSSNALLELADISILPENISEFRTPTDKALILVAFVGEQADSNQSIGEVSQHVTASFNISVQSMWLRGSKGVYSITELVKDLLIGLQIENAGPLSLSEHIYSDYQNEIWEHSLTFSSRLLRVQKGKGNYIPGTQITNEDIYYTKNTINENF